MNIGHITEFLSNHFEAVDACEDCFDVEVTNEGEWLITSLIPALQNKGEIESTIKQLLIDAGIKVSSVQFEFRAPSAGSSLEGVKNIVLVASGKGGVGKSTTTMNMARALSQLGASVGVLDADIYGPSVPMMFGVDPRERPKVDVQKKFLPIEVDGIQTMSLGYLTTDKTPVVWRGPMASGALLQMVEQTRWSDLDFLLIDMPPGTGDIQLSLSQKLTVSGAVVVTTPQDIALIDAQKAIEMFDKVSIPVFGIIENMSIHVCSHCGHQEAVFGQGGGESLAKSYQVPVLGQLPLNIEVRQCADSGESLWKGATRELGEVYEAAAQRLTVALGQSNFDEPLFEEVH